MRCSAASLGENERLSMLETSALSLCDLGRAIGAGKLCPVALCDAYLARIEDHPLGTRIYARLTPERARAEAMAARARAKAGTRRGLLDGVPLSWKDLFDTAGVATQAGSALLEGRVPAHDALVLRRAQMAGTVCLGKTHMSELAFSGLGLNPVTQTPPCVNDPQAVAGGSSSGAAASISFDLAPAAIGSDTGGSVRIPAAWNDLVGLKTTAKRIPLDGVVPLAASFDTVGPLTKTVEDAAALFAILDGSAPVDLRGASLSGTRFAVLETAVFDDIRATPAAGFEAAVDKLAAAGARIERISIPEINTALDLTGALYTPEAYAAWHDVIEASPDLMFDRILERFRMGAQFSASAHLDAWQTLRDIRRRYLAATTGFDAVLVPTAPIMPPNTARLMEDVDYYVTENLLSLRNTRVANLMGLAALTLPTGTGSVGISLQTGPNEEARLLRLGMAAQAALA